MRKSHQKQDPEYWTKVWQGHPEKVDGLRSSNSRTESKKRVMFSNVTVREYEIRPSDNPAVTSGAAIELGWNYYTIIESIPVVKFDEDRMKYRRKHYQYIGGMTPIQRRVRLSGFGFSKEEIDKATIQSAKLRRSNESSVKSMPFDRISELKEDIGRSWRRVKLNLGAARGPKPDRREVRRRRQHRCVRRRMSR